MTGANGPPVSVIVLQSWRTSWLAGTGGTRSPVWASGFNGTGYLAKVFFATMVEKVMSFLSKVNWRKPYYHMATTANATPKINLDSMLYKL
jgi:hypothetical protein